MTPDQVQPSRGTTHLVSKEDFCLIVNFTEPDDIENPTGYYEMKYVLAQREGKDLIISRIFQSNDTEGAAGFMALLSDCPGIKIIQEPMFQLLYPGQEQEKRFVSTDGKVANLARSV